MLWDITPPGLRPDLTVYVHRMYGLILFHFF